MILDLNDLDRQTVRLCDVCVIGSGAAGISAARAFLSSSHSVVMLEAGGPSIETENQDAYRCEVVGLSHKGVHEGRARVLGGTTKLWAGQALPLFAVDFAQREWVPYSGWPLDRTELEPYYRRAEEVMQLPHVTYGRADWPQAEAPPSYDASRIVPYFSQFTDEPDFVRKYGEELAASDNICVITHANVTSLNVSECARFAREVTAVSFDGNRLTVRPRFVIVCCGGIESARLLLLSDSVEPTGIGNRYDVVGRFFQDHPGVAVPVRPRLPKQFAALYDSFRRGRIRHALRLSASPELQRRERILHVGAEVYYPIAEDDPINAAKQVLRAVREPALRHALPDVMATIVRHPGRILRAVFQHYVRNQPPTVGSTTPHLGVGGEQEPNPASRITLSRETDRLGQRRAVLDWRLTASFSRSVETFVRAVDAEWRRLEIARVLLNDIQLEGREQGVHGGYVDANHHLGTTRMGTDHRTSVVDSRCRVHGYQNLYIGSSAVFPTGGASNPTLTIIALTLRITDDVKHALKVGDAVSVGDHPTP